MIKVLLLFSLGFIFTLLTSCGGSDNRESPPSQFSIDSELSEVSLHAALQKVQLESILYSSCDLAKILTTKELKESKNLNKKIKDIMRNMSKKYQIECDIYNIVKNYVTPVFDEIKKTHKLPALAFSFSIFEPAGELTDFDNFSEISVGLFPSIQTCTEVELLAHNSDIPTRKCTKWNPIISQP